MTTATSTCNDRGPRIGSDGVAYCVEPPEHATRHRADPSWGDVTWSNDSETGVAHRRVTELHQHLTIAYAALRKAGIAVPGADVPAAVVTRSEREGVEDDVRQARELVAEALGRVEAILHL